jgi:hypothetical protein
MAQAYHDLKRKNVTQLRAIAAGLDHEAVRGYTQLNKDHLLVAVCKALGVDMREHHDVVGLDKTEIKSTIRQLKAQRDEALASHDHTQLKATRHRIHRLKHALHRATV